LKELHRLKTKINPKSPKTSFDRLVLKELKQISKFTNEFEKKSKKMRTIYFKKQLIHHDLHPGNVIFNKNKVIAILDFNTLRKGVIIEDISFAALRFASEHISTIDKIQDEIDLFLESYLKQNEIDNSQIRYMKYFLIQKILGRLGYILRKKYFSELDSWSIDFGKNMKLLKLSNKIEFKY